MAKELGQEWTRRHFTAEFRSEAERRMAERRAAGADPLPPGQSNASHDLSGVVIEYASRGCPEAQQRAPRRMQ